VTDSYTGAIGNTEFALGTSPSGPKITGSGANPKANDTDPEGDTVSCVAETVSSTGGGSAIINSDCTYTFRPGVGDKSQTDSFTYHPTDGTLNGTGTIQVAIGSSLVWYVDRDAASNGDGRSHNPLQNLAGINGAGGSGDSDTTSEIIFLYSSATAYTGGLPLEASQQLIGEPQGLVVNATTLVAAGGSNPNVQNSGGNAITLAEGNTIRRVNVNSASGDGISGTNVNAADIGGSTTISGVAGADFKLSGGNGVVTVGSTIGTDTSGRVVDVQNRTGGSTTFNGNITTNGGSGIILNQNSGGHTTAFTGTLTISTGATAAFTATGSGTVTATGTGSTLTTTTGTALNVTNLIGAADLTFQTISANGATNGIVLNGTGSSGELHVTGTGSADSGGTIQNTTGVGISLTSTTGPVFDRMKLSGTNRSALLGTGVNGFTFTNGTILNAGDSLVDVDDGALDFNLDVNADNLHGAVTITGNTITNPYGNAVDIKNGDGTISDVNISSNTLTSATASATAQGSAIQINDIGDSNSVGSVTKGTIQNNTITNWPGGNGIDISGGNTNSAAAPAGTYGTPGSATNKITITGNSIRGDATTRMNGPFISTGVAGKGVMNVEIINNGTAAAPMANTKGEPIAIGGGGSVTASFKVTGNYITQNSNANLNAGAIGTNVSNWIQADSSVLRNPLVNADIENNTINSPTEGGIRTIVPDGNGTLNIKITGNNVASPTKGNSGIHIDQAQPFAGSGNTGTTVCAQVGGSGVGNTAGAGGNDGFGNFPPGISLLKGTALAGPPYKFGIVGLTPSPATTAQTEAYVATQNGTLGTGAGFYAGKTVYASDPNFTSCTLPVGFP
jgi:large repetitive protein